MRLLLAVVVALSVGCGARSALVDRATLAASSAMLAWDWSQTRGAAEQGWSGGRWEKNPIMGATPSSARVDTYFAAAAVLNVAIWCALPERWRSVVPIGVAGREGLAVYRNISTGATGTVH